MASSEQLKALRGHHAALTSHEQILKDQASKSTLIGEDALQPIVEELGRLERGFPDLSPRFTGRAQTFDGHRERYYNTAAIQGHVGSLLGRLTAEISAAATLVEAGTQEAELRDALTQLPDRGAFVAALGAALDEATREHQPLSLVFGDVDHFKKINDTHGHQTGDEILCEIAQRLERVVQGRGRAYRWGGEELILILRNHSVDEALAVAERARREIEAQIFVNGLAVSMSFGVSCFPDDAGDADSLVNAADKAMYDAKNRGRNLVRRFGEPPPTTTGAREPDRKQPQPGRLTEKQRAELRTRHLQGERVRCPEDGALLQVVDITPHDSGAGRQEFVVHCPNCGLGDQLQS